MGEHKISGPPFTDCHLFKSNREGRSTTIQAQGLHRQPLFPSKASINTEPRVDL